MSCKGYCKAAERFQVALKRTLRDYVANVLMAQCVAEQEKNPQTLKYARTATKIYPQEA